MATSQNVSVTGQVTDTKASISSLQAQVDTGALFDVFLDSAGHFNFPTTLLQDGSADGTHTIHLQAVDTLSHMATASVSFTLDTRAPSLAIQSPASGMTTAGNVTVTGQVSDIGSGAASLQAQVDSGPVTGVAVSSGGAFSFTTALALDGSADGPHTVRLRATDQAGNISPAADVAFTLDPSSAAAAAPPIDMTVATTVASATQFLYTGLNPIQRGVASGTIDPLRTAALVGKVQARDGKPLAGVTITILSHPGFGTTQTALDGSFEMAVNGGVLLNVNYAKDGYLPVQRQVQTPWNDYADLPDVVLIPRDSLVTALDLSANTPIQVARGSPVTDGDGTQQATLFFAQGTQATMTLPGGATQPLTALHVRATEYTVGATGPDAMPGDLPSTSGYTYAVDYSVDEAVAAGATQVGFDQPVISYLDNFLDFSVGSAVPDGFYDRSRGAWVPSDNGRVVKVVGVTGGRADLDIDGSGAAAGAAALTALGITDAERQQLASLYQPGQSLWRVPITHFSPWDCNWSNFLPPSATPPNQPEPDSDQPCTCKCEDSLTGSIIEPQNQILGEAAKVDGTPFSLYYASDRVPGRVGNDNLHIQLTGASVPPDLKRIDLKVFVGGRSFLSSFAATPNQSTDFTWDGKDVNGRLLQGEQLVTLQIGYVYPAFYQSGVGNRSFGSPGNGIVTGTRSRQDVTIWQTFETSTGGWDARLEGLGGWDLDVHNNYDPVGQILYLGDGSRRDAAVVSGAIVTTDKLTSSIPQAIAAGPGGSYYLATDNGASVVRINADGTMIKVTGNGTFSDSGDGGPATLATVNGVAALAVGPDGSLYLSEPTSAIVRRVAPFGIITTVAGKGVRGFSGDGGPATRASIAPYGIAAGPDGSLYIAEPLNNRIRRVDPSGIISTLAGTDRAGSGGDGGPAIQAQLNGPQGVAAGPDGSLYIADRDNNRIRRVDPSGFITTLAGTGTSGFTGDGGQAIKARLSQPTGLTVGSDGSLYITDSRNNRIRKVDPAGNINTLVGNGGSDYGGDGTVATNTGINLSAFGNSSNLAVFPDGDLLAVDTFQFAVRRVTSPLPGLSLSDLVVPAADGSEVYVFTSSGRHLRTVDGLTGAVRYQFSYDSAGRLISVTDGSANVTTIERDGDGRPTAVVAPGGQRTTLTLNSNGYLTSIRNPAGNEDTMTYSGTGLMTTFTDPRGNVHSMTYDAEGMLTRDTDPAGGFTALARSATARGFVVTVTTAEGRASSYEHDDLGTGEMVQIITNAQGGHTEHHVRPDGNETFSYPDGTQVTLKKGPDPRWGMLAPLILSETATTPGGLTQSIAEAQSATLDDPRNPLSVQALTDTITVNGQAYTTTFDAATNSITSTSPAGRQTVTTVDSLDRPVKEQVSGVDPISYVYDAQGRLVSVTQGTGTGARTLTADYNADNTLGTITDALGHTVHLAYDAAGRVTQRTEANGQVIGFSYDDSGHLTSLTSPGRPSYTFDTTPIDLVSTATAPGVGDGSSQTLFAYNLDRQLTRETLPDGQTVDLGYDSAGMLRTVDLATGQLRYTYDVATGNLKSMTAPDGIAMSYAYDGGLLTGTTWSEPVAGSVGRTYDNNFRTTSVSVNGANPISLQYDADGLLTHAGALTLTRDAQNGRVTGTALGTVTDARTYNNFGDVATYTASQGGTAVYSVQFTYDRLGRISQKVETIGGATDTYDYTYDLNGRLTQVQKDGSVVESYSYDSNGNRLSSEGPGGTVTGTYDAQDRLLTYGSTNYRYTANGNLLSKTDTSNGQTTSYEYDALGNLLHVSLPDGTQIDYLVDGEGRRIGKKRQRHGRARLPLPGRAAPRGRTGRKRQCSGNLCLCQRLQRS
jgi:YD repeat-containing protein